MKMSELKRHLALRLGDDAHYLEGRDKVFLAEVAGISAEQIEDDSLVEGDEALGWVEVRYEDLPETVSMKQQQESEYKTMKRQMTIDRGCFGGRYRIAAALALNGEKV